MSSGDKPPPYIDAEDEGEEEAPRSSVILAPGFNPFIGIRKAENKSILERMQSVNVELPQNLIIAKKSLVNTMSVLYTILLIVTCIVMVSTEVINYRDPLDTFQPKVSQLLI